MPAAYTFLHLVVKFTSLSPLIDNPSFTLNYEALGGSPILTDVNALIQTIGTKLTTAPSGATNAATHYLSPVVSSGANSAMINAYDVSSHLDGTPHGSPVTGTSFTPNMGIVSSSWPEGVCCAVTLQAPYGTDVEFAPAARPRSRDRGRFYFGPLITACGQQEATTNRIRLINPFVTDMLLTVKSLFSITTAGSITYQLGVWSRKNMGFKPPFQCWIDDRPDYVRLRADQAAQKTYQSLP